MNTRDSEVVEVGRQKHGKPGKRICAKREKEQKKTPTWEQQHRENKRTLPSLPDSYYCIILLFSMVLRRNPSSPGTAFHRATRLFKRRDGEPCAAFAFSTVHFRFFSLPLTSWPLFYFPARYPCAVARPSPTLRPFLFLIKSCLFFLSFVSDKEKMHILFSWCCFFFWESLI